MNSNRSSGISASASCSRRTSPGLSSMISIFVMMFSMTESLRELNQRKPKALDGMNHVQKLIQIYRFGDVAVRVAAVGPCDVLLGCRGRQDHYGDFHEMLVGLDLSQNLAAVFLRQV